MFANRTPGSTWFCCVSQEPFGAISGTPTCPSGEDRSLTRAWLDTPVPGVHYEDLKEEPAGEYSRVLKTLGFDVPPEDVERSIHKFSVDRFKEQVGDPQLPSERRMVRTGSSGDLRRHFNEDHKAQVKRIAGDLLVTLGYERDHEW